MRNEKQMYELILETARNDDRILAVYMNGSRLYKNAPKDIFQDYDIIYVVEETESFIDDKNWINIFGEILYMQCPDESPFYSSDKHNFYGWLMQFSDGNRIDLHVETVSHALEHIKDDSICKVLLDKKNILPEIEYSEETWIVKKPTQKEFLAICNEFWWTTNNLAKGLWRDEITYVQDMTNFCTRKQLEKMLSYKIGIITDFSVCIGKSGKYMKLYLDSSEWSRYLSTFFDSNIEHAEMAILTMCDMFEDTARFVAESYSFMYNKTEADSAKKYFIDCIHLPKNAAEIY